MEGLQTGSEGASVRGRKDSSGVAAIPKKISEGKLKDLEQLCRKADLARAEYNDAVTATAEKHGVKASAVSKVVKARVGDKFEEKKAEVEQMAFIFGVVDSVAPAADPSEN